MVIRRAHLIPTGYVRPVSETLPEVVERIAQELHPEKIVLFGSYAYGTPTPDSDVDLLVVLDKSVSSKERYLSVCRLLRPRPFPVDIIVKTPQQIAQALENKDYFIQEIITKGRMLYG